jgi:hypothetical protein
MADRYWVGGTGSWNSTTKWSTTSGGASGASVPTSSDNAIFDANSGTAHFTVTVTDNATCANLTLTPYGADGVTQFAVGVNFVIAGTFSTSGTQGNRRFWFRSSTYGLMRDMQIATIGTVTDVDFRDIRVTGTGGTLTGTRIGDLRGNVGITFSTPKNCFRIGTGNWSANQWSDTSGGSPNTDYFPLAQDTAVFDESTTAGTHTMDGAIPYTGSVDTSARTTPTITIGVGTPQTIYGNWTNSTNTAISGFSSLTFSGRNTQIITSVGRTFSPSIIIDSYGGSVEIADALNIGGNTLTIANGTFDTKNYNVTAGSLSSSNSNVRAILLGSSTVTLSASTIINFGTTTNLTFNAGTSQINTSVSGTATITGGGNVFYNVSFNLTSAGTHIINGVNTFNDLSVTAPSSAGLTQLSLSADQTITGTLTVAGATAVRRIFVRSNTLGTTRTLTVGTLAADDCDFRDITIAGTAAGSSPTRAGDCGGNSGITFPAAKTVYWNLSGAQNWSATAWAPSSGGTPDINEFPLAQDTAVFDDTGSAGTVTINAAWNIGTFDASARTSAMTLSGSGAPFVYGDWDFGTGVTSSNTGTITFSKRGTQTITSNGVTFGCPVTVDCATGTVQLADALSLGSTRTLTVTSGTFDAVTYNVTTGTFRTDVTTFQRTLKMGSGTWTISGTGALAWLIGTTNFTFYKGTADIVLSDTSTTARSFNGGGLSYNKLTIGGATGTSTLTIAGNNQFTELASTKTVAHTIALGTTTQAFGKWTVTGTSGNVVTLTGTGTAHILAGACTDSIDYLAMGSIGFSANSPGEFYAGANSTGTAGAPVYRTAKPADSTRYWVGGTGNWSDTARWSTSSGGSSGASVPRSHDDVVFDSLSNATAYTATVNAVTGGIRMKSLTIDGPASGNVTLAGSTAIVGIHGNVTLPATGLTRTYTGAITLSGSTSGLTLTTNGVALNSAITVNGVGCEWALGSAVDITSAEWTITNGDFDTANYNLTVNALLSDNLNSRTISLGSSTVTLGNGTVFVITFTRSINLIFNAGTSTIILNNSQIVFAGGGQTFYNVTNSRANSDLFRISDASTFNNLTIAGRTVAGVNPVEIFANQTINGTLTLSAGTNATMRHFVRSNTIGITRTLTCAAVSLTDVDFRDITIAGVAAPATGTRIGDCKGNSGITFDAAKTVYWRRNGGGNWQADNWSATDGGSLDVTQFPLPQDTAVFNTYPPSGITVTINTSSNIGTIDMSARTTDTMTLACSQAPFIYGNWINGTGTTISGTAVLTFAGRGSQVVTSAGKTFTTPITVDSPSGSVSLQDAFICGDILRLNSGTFNAVTYNVTLNGSFSAFASSVTAIRTTAVGSGTWTISGSGTVWNTSTSTNLTVTGTGTISLTSASAKTFAGGGIDYSGIILNQGGAGTLTISGNNTFANITNTYSATGATTIAFGTTTQRVGSFTATGAAGNVLTLTGTSASSPCTLVHTGSGIAADVDYLTITGVRAY